MLVDSAGFDDCRKLLTAHVRQERFCEGHLAAEVLSGAMVRLVRRIVELAPNAAWEPHDWRVAPKGKQDG